MLDSHKIRQSFPALRGDNPPVFLDGPGGTQLPFSVIQAMSEFMAKGVANLGGFYQSSNDAQQQMDSARIAVAALINAKSFSEVSFGQNMTSLTFALAHALANRWQAGDNIIVTELDHEANIGPWLIKAKEKNVDAHILPFNADSYELQLDLLEAILQKGKTKLIAITLASNICGSITNIDYVSRLAKQYHVQLFVDAVHFIAHHKVDVQVINCDWMVCSGYKFCAPHIGILYSKAEAMSDVLPYKIAPAPQNLPYGLETGTQNFEAMAGLEAAIYHKASLVCSQKKDLVKALQQSMCAIEAYENSLKSYFIQQVNALPFITVHGHSNVDCLAKRTPTFALSIKGIKAKALAQALAKHTICVGYGHFYVPRFINKLDLDPSDGVLRVGFSYYNTQAEIDYLIKVLRQYCLKEHSELCHEIGQNT